MTQEPDPARPLASLVDALRIAMVTTASGSALMARPLTMLEHVDDTLRFLVANDADWVRDVMARGPVPAQASFAYPSDSIFVALSGDARVVLDAAVAKRLWNPAAEAFFEGPDDPRLAVLEFTVQAGEYWDGPDSGVGQALAFVRTLVTGRDESMGEHGPVS